MAVARRLTTLALALTVGACGADPAAADDAPAPSLRSGRFGSLRDFVLLDRADPSRGGALFVDRFEATQADWSEFAETPEGRAVAADQVALVGRDERRAHRVVGHLHARPGGARPLPEVEAVEE